MTWRGRSISMLLVVVLLAVVSAGTAQAQILGAVMGAVRAWRTARNAKKDAASKVNQRPRWLQRRAERQQRRAQLHETFDRDGAPDRIGARDPKPDFRQRLSKLNPKRAFTAVVTKLRAKAQRRRERQNLSRNDRDPKTLHAENQKRNKRGWVAEKAPVGQVAHRSASRRQDMGRPSPQYVAPEKLY